jgi:phosphopantetheinyl transferase
MSDYKTQLIDGVEATSHVILIDGAITVEVAKINHSSRSRAQHRKVQSLSARKLLSGSLNRLYGRAVCASWTLMKLQSGKPYLYGENSPLISIAHSCDWVVCAVKPSSSSATIGVDVEVIKYRNWEACCQYAFHPLEIPWILSASGEERNIRGLTCWCRKEAIVKSLGVGLTVAPSEIGFSPEGTLIVLPEELGSPVGWSSFSTVVQGKAVVVATWKC